MELITITLGKRTKQIYNEPGSVRRHKARGWIVDSDVDQVDVPAPDPTPVPDLIPGDVDPDVGPPPENVPAPDPTPVPDVDPGGDDSVDVPAPDPTPVPSTSTKRKPRAPKKK